MLNTDEIMVRIKAISERLKSEYHAEKVILFGSYARGEATEDSDIDIFIIAPTQERFYERMATTLRITRDLYRGIPISPIILRPDEVEKRLSIGDQFVKEIIEEGIEI
jgi:predicted nucleotidyltransferase